MKLLRKVIFWCHLFTGVCAGIVVLVMSVTGVLLAYERQLTAWADQSGYPAAPHSPAATRLPVETLLARARQTRPSAAPSAFTLRADPSAPAEVAFGRESTVFLNPYTGEVLGEGSKRARAFFRTVTDWHRWLGAQGDNRAAARAVTGACNLGFLFLVSSGFYLWWPRNWTRRQLRSVTWFRRGLRGRSRDFNWHNVVGFWCCVPLFVVVLSAVVISYTWASNLVYRLAGEAPPAPAQRPAPAPPANNALDGLDRLWALAEQQVAGWQSINAQLPASAEAPVTFAIDQGNGGQPQKRGQLTLDRAGEVVRWEPFSSYTLGRRLRSLLRFAHTGEVAGVFGQTVAALASAGGAALVITGLALAWRRLRAWAARRAGGVALSPQPGADTLSGATGD